MKAGRWSLLVALGALAVVSALWLYQTGPGGGGLLPGCAFRNWTGFHCPGCGMTRATYSALHGEWATAFRFNPLGMLLLPLATVGFGLEMIAWARGERGWFRLMPGPRIAIALAAVVILYWILRNLPWWPFTLLAPV